MKFKKRNIQIVDHSTGQTLDFPTFGKQAGEEAINELEQNVDNKIAELKSLVGTPLKASTASAMNNRDKIYVYTGNETGYTNGHWYYYDGSKWVDGGVYNSTAVETDKTLSVENMPADAKKTGDEINTLMSELAVTSPYNITWSQGGINNSGTAVSRTNRIRTDYITIENDSIFVEIPSGFKYAIHAYTASKTRIGYIPSGSDIMTDRKATYKVSESYDNAVYFRMWVAYADDSNILPTEGDKVTVAPYESVIDTLKSHVLKSVRILGVGNSYTRDSIRWLCKILKESGYEDVIVGHGYLGASTLAEQYASLDSADSNHSAFEYWKYNNTKNATKTSGKTLDEIFVDEPWDIVVFQQQSDESGQYASYVSSNFDINDFITYISGKVSNADLKFAIMMPWSHADGYTSTKFTEYYNSDPRAMLDAIKTVIPQVADHMSQCDYVVNAGEAIDLGRQNSYLNALGDQMLRTDKNHLYYGIPSYMVGLVYALTLCDVNLNNVMWYPTATDEGQTGITTSGYLAYLAKQCAGAAADAKETGDQISQLKSDINTVTTIIEPKNWLNKNDDDYAANKVINVNTGNLNNNTSYSTTGYIPVEAGAYYGFIYGIGFQKSELSDAVYYDSNKERVSGASNIAYGTVIPTGVAYIRFSMQNIRINASNVMFCKLDSSDESVTSYYEYFDPYRVLITDDTLSIENMPADAKATGNAIGGKMSNPATIGTNGQVLTSNGDGTYSWKDVSGVDTDATVTSSGLMSASDKRKLDNIVNPGTINISGSGVTKNASAYGFLPTNDADTNSLAFKTCIAGGGTILVDYPGTYQVSESFLLESNTEIIFGDNVYISIVNGNNGKHARYQFANTSTQANQPDENITIRNLHLITNGLGMGTDIPAQIGRRGFLSFFHIKRLVLDGIYILDSTDSSNYNIHIQDFDDVVIKNIILRTEKDGLHFNLGKNLVIKNCDIQSNDDAIALNSMDWVESCSVIGWIENVLIENFHIRQNDGSTVYESGRGVFCYCGSWKNWETGMSVREYGDTVVSEGRIYRTFGTRGTTTVTSTDQPTHESGTSTYSDGITWLMVQDYDVGLTAGVKNLTLRDINFERSQQCILKIYTDDSSYCRAIYPGSTLPVCNNILLDNIKSISSMPKILDITAPTQNVRVTNSFLAWDDVFASYNAIADYDPYTGEDTLVVSGNTLEMTSRMNIMIRATKRKCRARVVGNIKSNDSITISNATSGTGSSVSIETTDII